MCGEIKVHDLAIVIHDEVLIVREPIGRLDRIGDVINGFPRASFDVHGFHIAADVVTVRAKVVLGGAN